MVYKMDYIREIVNASLLFTLYIIRYPSCTKPKGNQAHDSVCYTEILSSSLTLLPTHNKHDIHPGVTLL